MNEDAATALDEGVGMQDQLLDDVEKEEIEGEDTITHPFDPTLIRIRSEVMSTNLLISRIEEEGINLNTDFQRHAGIWDGGKQSRLIESFLIRIPIPAFYMDATDDDEWLVIDGLQRLETLRRFCIEKSLELKGLEFLRDYEGFTFDELPRNLQRRIEETQATVFKMEAGTPPEVKFNVFKRINTGGVNLNAQEIRHALYHGNATEFLVELAESAEFKNATAHGVGSKRMADRECVLRFLAFAIVPYQDYPSGDLDAFLNKGMAEMNAMDDSQLADLRSKFIHAMRAACKVFGDDAFRKPHSPGEGRKPINRALFEAWAVNLSRLTENDVQCLTSRSDDLRNRFAGLMKAPEFEKAVSQGTGDKKRVEHRFSDIERIIKETLQ